MDCRGALKSGVDDRPSWLQRAAMKLVTVFCRRVTVMALPLEDVPGEPLATQAEVFDFLGADEEDAYAAFRPNQPLEVMRRRLRNGERCLVARRQGRIVCAIWAVTGRPRDSYLGVWLALEPGEVYWHDAFTRPDCRQLGLARACYGRLARVSHDEGLRRAIGMVAVENRPGRRVCESVGFRAVGTYGCLRLGPWRHHWQRVGMEQPPKLLTGRQRPA